MTLSDPLVRISPRSPTAKFMHKLMNLPHVESGETTSFVLGVLPAPVPVPPAAGASPPPGGCICYAPLLVGEGSQPLLCRPSGDWSRISSIRCVPTY